MADTKTTALAALTGASLATGDLAEVVDVSDTTMDAAGTNKKITAGELKIGLATTLGMVAIDKIFDAKGDLAVGTGADAAAKLTAGSNGQAVYADSSQTTGLSYVWTSAAAKPTSTYHSVSARGGNALTLVLNTLYFVTLPVAVGHAYTNFGCRVEAAASAGGTVRIGLYAATSAGLPGALITDGGTVATTSTGNKFVSISYTPVAPFVWVALVPQGNVTAFTINGPNNASNWYPGALWENSSQISGALRQSTTESGALPANAGTIAYDNWSGGNFTAMAY